TRPGTAWPQAQPANPAARTILRRRTLLPLGPRPAHHPATLYTADEKQSPARLYLVDRRF
ncbi:MAG: hypothetical protein AAB658_03275, partial [Chloroflexota bacterium]